ncbi:MAG TPA: VPDSG-CTERM sorting domain-containing protein [Lacunisphaera sp.]|nr:VPDSG-CTERM sorting domain-containing protein [Lacunisphaera sp.]
MKLKVLALGAALCAGRLFANSVVLTDTANDGNLNGGEFLATSTAGTFLTFCLERTVTVNMSTPYTFTIDSRALTGGNDQHDPSGPGPAGDPLSAGTAWLYTQFILGTLVDTDGSGLYGDAGTHAGLSARDYNAGVLQTAIWILEDEIDASNYDSNPYFLNNEYINLLTDSSHFGSLAAAQATYTGDRVKVMNIWEGLVDKQSQLIYVPDTGMTVVLLGLGLVSLAIFRRRS